MEAEGWGWKLVHGRTGEGCKLREGGCRPVEEQGSKGQAEALILQAMRAQDARGSSQGSIQDPSLLRSVLLMNLCPFKTLLVNRVSECSAAKPHWRISWRLLSSWSKGGGHSLSCCSLLRWLCVAGEGLEETNLVLLIPAQRWPQVGDET